MSDEVTPPLDEFIAAYEQDDNTWWRTDCGHHMNLFEAAVERMQAAESASGGPAVDRYRLAWLSARRRASDNRRFAAEIAMGADDTKAVDRQVIERVLQDVWRKAAWLNVYDYHQKATDALVAALTEQPKEDEKCQHAICKFDHDADGCGWCPECHPEVPEW